MTGRCATCRHWVPFDVADKGWWRGASGKVKLGKRMGLCSKADGIEVDPTTDAIAGDGSDYRADLRTAPTFGCTMYESTK